MSNQKWITKDSGDKKKHVLINTGKKPREVKVQNPGSTTVLDIQKMRDGLSQAVKGKEWSGRKPEMYSQNGEVFTTLTNSSHTVMIYENVEGTAPSDSNLTFKDTKNRLNYSKSGRECPKFQFF